MWFHCKKSNKQQKEQNTCLKIINCSKYFDDLKAVDNYNGELFSNEIFCLLGHNGAGKTTLMSILAGILKPNIMDDYEVEKVNPVYIPSEIRLYDFITVSEFIDIYLSLVINPLFNSCCKLFNS